MTSAPDPTIKEPSGIQGAAGTPLYARIRARLKLEIASGEYAQGDHLPPADELARRYGANKNTILRALRLLRSEGVVDFGRGRGAVVLHSAQRVELADLSVQLRQFVRLADESGIPRGAIISAIERMPRMPAGARGRSGGRREWC